MHEVDYYELLGVRRNASPAEIKAAYRALAKAAHPDMGGTAGMFHLLRTAYDTLSDPDRRADYDDTEYENAEDEYEDEPPVEAPAPDRVSTTGRTATRWRPRRTTTIAERTRRFGEDPGYVPEAPELDVASIDWWENVDSQERIRHDRVSGPGHCPTAGAVAGLGLLVLPILLQVELDAGVVIGWLVLAAAVAAIIRWTTVRYRALAKTEQSFAGEFGTRQVFGKPGSDADQVAERLTAALLATYLTRMPGVRVFHGLAWPGSVFADIDHAVLCGRRLVLIESKTWLPGHYTTDGTGFWRDNRPFRGGGSLLPEGLAAFRELLPDVEVRGVLIVYPSRDGEITTDEPAEADIPPMTPEQFVHEIGGRLAAEPSTVDSAAFRTVLRQVVGT
ncbi:MAG: hypothetical protein QOI21_1144 [Actinomycetota bacterium]|nr:hypothetical protein [Actinomycetota bacterium]